ncbi:hypothetical protein ATY77_20935 [Rhizobium sp. R634]|uniref:hypothetical protein n=1 Tax=Rhizobium sp. R634 TaxID=1764274 RepID=UPI000B52E145|nr:hypothetical protein [Rhizobium sp. R634]OWV69634.1 hypothetical protein ATY77_20935 [Rhizobium sp. R634]
MPIIYVHGVNTRDPRHFEPVHEYLRRIVAPSIAPDPENVRISAADWFQLCDPPKWGGIARPSTPLLGQGAEVERRELLDAIVAKLPRSGPASSSLTSGHVATPNQYSRIEGLTPDDLADLITVSAASNSIDGLQRARIGIAADRVARDLAIQRSVKAANSLEKQLAILAASVQESVEQQSTLAGQGAAQFLRSLPGCVSESLSRIFGSPIAVASLIAGELRPTLNDFVTRFVGDVLFYMTLRGTANAPGAIPQVLISELEFAAETKRRRSGEPIVLLTHSMGGQIAYDVLTSFLPEARSEVKVDFWCATASQVGYFEELNMFLASSKNFSRASGLPTPFPCAHLGRWWNVWDPNDIISFTTKGIFANGIDDEKYWSGMSLAAAHGGYLERPSFYRRFADKLKTAFPVGGAEVDVRA